jgi:hypothetical protein
MKVKNAHMQAFPFIEPHEDDNIKAYHPGMTMRDEFAKVALLGIIASERPGDEEFATPDMYARDAYRYADAMMKARK